MSNKMRWIKALGIVAALIGSGAALVTDWVERQEIDELIDLKIKDALAEQSEEDEES